MNNFKLKSTLALLLLLLCHTTVSWAWGTTGHRVVAEIAEQHLTRKAQRNIRNIIGDQKLAYWANWPDFIKSDSNWKFADSWHYVNIPAHLDRIAFDRELEQSSDENIYKRLLWLMDQLENKSLPKEKKQEYLYFLIHLIGDAHQPLHIGRSEDLGGNKISVDWFKKTTNLHALWDSYLVDFEKYSYKEYAEVLNIHNKKHNKKLSEGNVLDWIYDSYTLANQIYKINDGASLSYRYHYEHKNNIENQLLKGGVRLAKVLNLIFG